MPGIHLQFSGLVDPHEFQTGTRDVRSHATFGKPDGWNASYPDDFMRSHSQPFHETRKGEYSTSCKHTVALTGRLPTITRPQSFCSAAPLGT